MTSSYLEGLLGKDSPYKQISSLYLCKQDRKWHPEGNVGIHTELVCNEMYLILTRIHANDEIANLMMYAALCHDIGKPSSTFFHEGKQKLVSYGHDEIGAPIARAFLKELGFTDDLFLNKVYSLTRCHMSHTVPKWTEKSVKKLTKRLFPATIQELVYLMEADCRGRGTASSGLPVAVSEGLIPISKDIDLYD